MLSRYRVLDLTDESGFLAGKILGDLGAEVIKIEPPSGDAARAKAPYLGGLRSPERSLLWLSENTSKKGLTLDLGAESGRALFRRLAETADVVLESFRPGTMDELGIGFEALRTLNPGIVHCAITPFGQTGPFARYRAHDLVIVAMGGNASATGDPSRPPLRCSMPTAYYHAAPEAALGVLMALHAREKSGRGEFVDISIHECQLQSLLSFPGQVAHGGKLQTRPGPRIGRTREIWPARDGYVTFGLRGGPQRIPNLIATVEYMNACGAAPDWLRGYDWSAYNHNTLSDAEIARLEDAFGAFFRTKTMRELYDEALARRILLAPCNDAKEILGHPQLRERNLFVRIDYPELGATIEHPRTFAWSSAHDITIRHRAPRIGEHNDEILSRLSMGAPSSISAASTLAAPKHAADGTGRDGSRRRMFDGLKILELGSGAAAPVAARYFAEHGARIIRIESSRRPDFLRVMSLTPDNPHGLDGAPMFVLLNPNKESVAVDLSRPEGVALAKRLVAWADVVSENFAPGVMAKWGLDYESLRRTKPDLIMVSGCLFGQTGPQRSYAGFGGQSSAISGFNHMTGWPDREALGPFGTITDSLAPRYVALLITAALLERRRTGRGQHLDVAQTEVGVYSLSEMIVRYSANGEIVARRGNHDEHAAPHAIYPCRGSDRWIAIAVFSDDEWRELRRAMGDPDWAHAPRFDRAPSRLVHQAELDDLIAAWTRDQDDRELMARLQAHGVEAGIVQNHRDLLDDPQLRHRSHFRKLEHPHLGEMTFEHSGIVFSDHVRELTTPGPNLGEHTRKVLLEILGMSDQQVEELIATGVLV